FSGILKTVTRGSAAALAKILWCNRDVLQVRNTLSRYINDKGRLIRTRTVHSLFYSNHIKDPEKYITLILPPNQLSNLHFIKSPKLRGNSTSRLISWILKP